MGYFLTLNNNSPNYIELILQINFVLWGAGINIAAFYQPIYWNTKIFLCINVYL